MSDAFSGAAASRIRIPVAVVHCHEVMRLGLEHAWSTSPEVCVVASSDHWTEIADALETTQIRVALIGLWPNVVEASLVGQLAKTFDHVKWLALTPQPEDVERHQLQAAGVVGYLHQFTLLSRITSVISWIDAGRSVLDDPDALTSAMPIRFDQKSSTIRRAYLPIKTQSEQQRQVLDATMQTLSQRETEVLRGLSEGFTNQQIADRLYLSVKTIETYRARLKRKLDVTDRASMIALLNAVS